MSAASESLPSTPPQAGEASAKRMGVVLVILALASALLLSRPMFSNIPLALDEHGSYWIVQPDGGPSVWERCQRIVATPPLGSWLQQGSLALFGKSEWALRLPLVIAYLTAVGLMYRLGDRIDGPLVGGLAALIVAWNPHVVDEVLIGRFYGLVVLGSTALLACTLLWRRATAAWGWSITWSVATVVLIWSQYVTIPFVGLCWLAAAWPEPTVRRNAVQHWGPWWLAAGLTAALCSPLLSAIQRLREWSPYLDGFAQPVSWRDLATPIWWAGCPAAIVCGFVADRCVRRQDAQPATHPSRREWLVLAGLTFGLMLAGAVAQNVGLASLANARYRVSAAVPGALLLARLLASFRSRPAAIGGSLTALVAAWLAAGHSPLKPPRLDNPMDYAWRDMARVIEREGRPGEPVCVQCGLVEGTLVPAYFEDSAFSAYVGLSMSQFYLTADHPRIALPFLWQRPLAMSDWYRRRILETPTGRVWLAAAADTDLNQSSIAGFDALARAAGLTATNRREFARGVLVEYVRDASD
jgi:hypothetical protein